jgi:hypothetical protein
MAREPIRTEAREPARVEAASFFDDLPDTRQREVDDIASPFDIDKHRIPPGVTLEWKRYTTLGSRDQAYENKMLEQGWRPVPTKLFPDFMPQGTPPDDPVVREGNMLMARRQELTDQARDQERRAARQQIQTSEARMRDTPADTMPRDAPATRQLAGINRTVERIPVPRGDDQTAA